MGAKLDKGVVIVHNTDTSRYFKLPLESLPADKRTVRGLLEHFNIDVDRENWFAYDRANLEIDLDRPLVPGDRIRWAKDAINAHGDNTL